MKLKTLCLLNGLMISGSLYAAIQLELAVIRQGAVALSELMTASVDGKAHKAYQDANTYIEIELIEEKSEQALIQFTVATVNESRSLVVRGMPYLVLSLEKGLGMTSLQCAGTNEVFTLLIAAVKV